MTATKTQALQEKKKNRLTVIDLLRGVSVICMIVYHTLWDLVFVHGVDIPWFLGEGASVFQSYIRWSFILLSGFSWSLGRSKIKRGVTVLLASAIITLFSYFTMPDSMIKYGILTLIGSSMLLTVPADMIFKKVQPFVGLALSFAFFMFTVNAEIGTFGFGKLFSVELPRYLYANELTAYLGFPPEHFRSSDYAPIVPWLFLFFAGYFIYGIFKKYDLLKHLSCVSLKPLEFIGRHSLIIYMIHQPLIYGVLYLIFCLI